MTKDAINRAIAEWRGWKDIHPYDGPWEPTKGILVGLKPVRADNGFRRQTIPNFFEDLNAIAEAEGALDSNQWEIWHRIVADRFLTEEQPYAVRISAPQRCEALLRCLKLWKE